MKHFLCALAILLLAVSAPAIADAGSTEADSAPLGLKLIDGMLVRPVGAEVRCHQSRHCPVRLAPFGGSGGADPEGAVVESTDDITRRPRHHPDSDHDAFWVAIGNWRFAIGYWQDATMVRVDSGGPRAAGDTRHPVTRQPVTGNR